MHEEQPLPRHCPGVEGAHDVLIRDLSKMSMPVSLYRATVFRVEQRKQVGLDRYGQLLCPDDGRDTLRDAMEEALDLCVYLCNCVRLGMPLRGTYELSIVILLDLVRVQAGLEDVPPPALVSARNAAGR